MTPVILAAVMAASPVDSCYVSRDPASGASAMLCGITQPENIGNHARITRDTIGYWLDRRMTSGHCPNSCSGDRCTLAYCAPMEIIDTVYVIRRPR